MRDGWLILGGVVLLLVGLESFLRIQGAIGHAWTAAHPRPAVPSPLVATDWYPAYLDEFNRSRQLRWEPYLYFRRPPHQGTYITVDSLGRRVTPQPTPPAGPVVRVFFFGGSTMWGSYQRDEHTIPAEEARRFASARSGPPVVVTNFGESGYVFTQEMLALILQLRAGNVPDVVVFYDGINDVVATLQDGAAGIPQNESNRAAEFAMGRALRPTTSGLGSDLGAWAALAEAGLGKMELTRRLQGLVRRPSAPLMPADSAVEALVRVYTGNVRVIESLARSFGFQVIYVWQPSLHATRKRLTPFESQLMAALARSPFQQRVQEVHQELPPALDSAMAVLAPGRFVDASGLFAGDSLPVYVDQIGHTTEGAVPRIVDAFWPELARAVGAASRSPGTP
jgi:hypothetical protein